MKQAGCFVFIWMLNLAIGAENIWEWQRIDCTYQNNIESLFEHCSPLEQEFIDEARAECGEENWGKLQKWIGCGCPQATTIKAKGIQEAYQAFILQYKNNEGLLESLPLQDMKKEFNEDSFIQYLWKGNTYLRVSYSYDLQTRCDDTIFFDLGNGNIKIVVSNDIMCK